MRFAMKANAIDFGFGWQDIQKKPATDPSKASKAGRQAVIRIADTYETIREDKLEHLTGETNLLEPVYCNGKILREDYFENIRDRAHKEMLTFHGKVFNREVAEAAE
jgi:nicotinamide phosphoribosyltransferase